MSTRAEMIAEMASDMERSDSAAFTSKINAAIRQYQPRRFWFNESRSVTFQTTASTDTYSFSTIGTEFYRIDGVFLTVASDDVRELERWDYSRMMEEVAGEQTATDVPRAWAYVDRGMRLWRSPDDAYTVRLLGHVKLAAPASDEETDNLWMTEAYDLIMCRAKAELYAHRYEDPEKAQIMRLAEGDALKRLLNATDDKVAPGYLEATEF
jgi:hypothetical protein